MYVDPRKELRHAELVGVLEVVCETLELSDSDYEVVLRLKSHTRALSYAWHPIKNLSCTRETNPGRERRR
jgi:hypothetical protein